MISLTTCQEVFWMLRKIGIFALIGLAVANLAIMVYTKNLCLTAQRNLQEVKRLKWIQQNSSEPAVKAIPINQLADGQFVGYWLIGASTSPKRYFVTLTSCLDGILGDPSVVFLDTIDPSVDAKAIHFTPRAQRKYWVYPEMEGGALREEQYSPMDHWAIKTAHAAHLYKDNQVLIIKRGAQVNLWWFGIDYRG